MRDVTLPKGEILFEEVGSEGGHTNMFSAPGTLQSGRQRSFAMTQFGYYRYATVANDSVVFVCEDDLWSVDRRGGAARRLDRERG